MQKYKILQIRIRDKRSEEFKSQHKNSKNVAFFLGHKGKEPEKIR